MRLLPSFTNTSPAPILTRIATAAVLIIVVPTMIRLLTYAFLSATIRVRFARPPTRPIDNTSRKIYVFEKIVTWAKS